MRRVCASFSGSIIDNVCAKVSASLPRFSFLCLQTKSRILTAILGKNLFKINIILIFRKTNNETININNWISFCNCKDVALYNNASESSSSVESISILKRLESGTLGAAVVLLRETSVVSPKF